MTFDIDKAMSDRFAKAGGAAFVPDEDSYGYWENIMNPTYINPDDPEERLDQFGQELYEAEKNFGEPNEERAGVMIWDAPVNSEGAIEARAEESPAPSNGAELADKQIARRNSMSKIDLDKALIRAGLGREARDLATWYIYNGYDFDKAVKMAQTQQINRSFDIDKAMEAASQTKDTFDIQLTTKPRPDNRRR